MLTYSEFNLPQLSAWHKKQFLGYATQVLESQRLMTTAEGKNILHFTLSDNDCHEHLIHYPKGDRIDHRTGSQYFYHCHRENYDSREHGHFHCFLRYPNIPKSIKPAPLADWDRYMDNPMTHLIAIGMNQLGQPIRLFTVNRWVTSEVWYGAEHSHKFLKRFKMTLEDPYWQVLDQWIEGMLHLFTPQIVWLHHKREKKIQEYQRNHLVDNPYMDYDLDSLSEITIDLKRQIEWVIG